MFMFFFLLLLPFGNGLATWTKHYGINCYPGHGGTAIDPSDTPFMGKTLYQCKVACEGVTGCVAIVVRTDGQQVGYCWVRSSVQVSQCEPSANKFDTYTKASGPRLGSFMVLGDWGYDSSVHGNVKPGCQKAIAKEMNTKMNELGDVKFVINVGDSFYPAGVGFGDSQWTNKWLNVYGPTLTALPWFGVYGNHDYQGRDKCSCSYDNSGCSQIHTKLKGWTMPDVNYYDDRFLKELNLEIIGLDLNAVDYLDGGQGICHWAGCGLCQSVINKRTNDAKQLFSDRMLRSTARNFVAFSHYPTDYLSRAGYHTLLAQLSNKTAHNTLYFGGHRHNVDQSKVTSTAPNDNWLVGGGGGWGCDGWSSGGKNQQGFVVGEIHEDYTMSTYSVLVPSYECC